MQMPSGGRRSRRFSLVLVALTAVLAAAAGPAQPSGPHGLARPATAVLHTPLRLGDHGQRVRDLQWLLSGNRPSVYRRSVHPYSGPIDGRYGPRTAKAVRAAKWRLGYPQKELDGRAGNQLFAFLLGKKARPLGWIGRASKRVHAAIAGQTVCSRRITAVARAELGVHEIPNGSNDGPRVRVYQAVTGAYHAAWCASFAQYVLRAAGVGTIADRSAGVFYIASWAHRHTLLHALPKPGALVIYLHALGHMGVVERVTKSGFYTIEGNAGNAVRRRWHPTGYAHTVFVWLPHCTPTGLARLQRSSSTSSTALFRSWRGLFYDNIATTGGVRVDKLRTVPGGGINLVILSPRDDRATLGLRDSLTSQGIRAGLNTDPHWYAGTFPSSWRDDNGRALPDPLLYRRQVSADTQRLLRVGDPVVLDFEKVPRAWAQAFLEGSSTSSIAGWRGRGGHLWNGGTNESRPTAWTNEPHQANPGDLIAAAQLAYLAQLYDGAMTDRAAWQELQWNIGWRLRAEDSFPVYDAADYQLDELQDGAYLFNQDRLAWLFQ